MPYKKGGAAEARAKVRRTAKRRISRLEKEINRSDDVHAQQLYRSQIETLRQNIERTYERNPLTNKATGFGKDELRIAIQNLTRANENALIGTSSRARNDFLTQQELNLAQDYDFIGPTQSQYTKQEASIFYAATREAWEGLPSTANRNRAILEYYAQKNPEKFKGKSLSEMVDIVLSMNERAVRQAHTISEYLESNEELTPEEKQEAAEGSALWYATVVTPDSYNPETAAYVRPE